MRNVLAACAVFATLAGAASAEPNPTPDLSQAYREKTATRLKICLNGWWYFQYAPEPPQERPPRDGWGYIRVPSFFSGYQFWVYDEEKKPIKGRDGLWRGKKRCEYGSAWYRREIRIPVEWAGKRVFVQAKGKVFFNGQLMGEYSIYDPLVEVTPAVRLGGVNVLDVLVQGKPAPSWQPGPGLDRNTWLYVLPSGPVVDDVFVVPSVVSSTLTVHVRVANPTDAPARVRVACEVLDGERAVLQLPAQELAVPARGTAQATAQATWRDFREWLPRKPYLYRLRTTLLDARGQLSDEHVQRFGFRGKLVARNGDFYLGGKKIHFRMSIHPYWANGLYGMGNRQAIEAFIRDQMAKGFNGAQTWALDDDFARDICDELGFMLCCPVPKEANEEQIRKLLERYRNHPSIMFWRTDRWVNLDLNNIHPDLLDGSSERLPVDRRRTAQRLAQREQLFKKYDPLRLVIHYGCGNAGEIYCCLPYLPIGMPLQERCDWPSKWAATKRQPLALPEFDFVHKYAYRRMDWADDTWQESESELLEQAARYLGDDMYQLARRPLASASAVDAVEDVAEGFKQPRLSQVFTHITALQAKEVMRAWRGYGVSYMAPWFASGEWSESSIEGYEGTIRTNYTDEEIQQPGAFPEEIPLGKLYFIVNPVWEKLHPDLPMFRKTPVYDVAQKNWRDILIYIGGYPEFTDKGHAYFGGQTMLKRLVAINDTMEPLTITVSWDLVDLDGNVAHTDRRTITLQPGEIYREPIVIRTPWVEQRTPYKLRLIARDTQDKVLATDELDIELFPPSSSPSFPEGTPPLALYDEVGLTENLFRAANVPYRRISSLAELQPTDQVLVVGRQSLTARLDGAELSRRIAAGLRVLCFEQDKSSLIGPALDEVSERWCWIAAPHHPVLAGLEDRDMRNWRGESDLIEPYARYPETKIGLKFPKWGNKGIVATYVLRRPTYGSYITLLTCGYDRRNTPLLEIIHGAGRIIFCQLDITNRHGFDPIAGVLFNRLLEYIATPKPLPLTPYYIGGPQGAKLLDEFFVARHEVVNPPDIRPEEVAPVLLIGDLSERERRRILPKLHEFLGAGGTVLYLPGVLREEGWLPDFPVSVRLEQRGVFRSSLERRWPLLDGLCGADFYFRAIPKGFAPSEEFKFYVVAQTSGRSRALDSGLVAEIPYGAGRVILCQVDPEVLRGWRAYPKFVRIFSTILTNLRVKFTCPLTLTPPLEVDLAGQWFLQLDPDDRGVRERWFEKVPFGKVSASSNGHWQRMHKVVSWAYDGDTNTAWLSRRGEGVFGGEWLEFDFERPRQVERAEVQFSGRPPLEFRVQRWEAGARPVEGQWRDVLRVANAEGRKEFSLPFAPLTTQKLRLLFDKVDEQVSVAEVRIFGEGKELTAELRSLPPRYPVPYDDGRRTGPPINGYIRTVYLWEKITLNGRTYQGPAWFSTRFYCPEELRGKEVHLIFGSIADDDWVYVNGKLVAQTVNKRTSNEPWGVQPRDYQLPPDALRYGEINVLSVRVVNKSPAGGIVYTPVKLMTYPKLLLPQTPVLTYYNPDKFFMW